MKAFSGLLLAMVLVLPACGASHGEHEEPDVRSRSAGQAGAALPVATKNPDAGTPVDAGVDMGAEYVGTRRLSGPLPAPDDGSRARNAQARAYFEPGRGGESMLRIVEEGQGPFRLRVEVPGRLEANGSWSGEDANTRIDIDQRGSVSGTGDMAPFRIFFSGSVSRARFALRLELRAEESGVVPESSRLVYDYDLQRRQPVSASTTSVPTSDDPARSGERAGGGEQADCKRIRWKLKNVTDFNGGLDMVRVPVCEDE